MRALAVLALAACGRIGFDFTGTSGDDGNGPSDGKHDGIVSSTPFTLVAAPSHGSFSGTTYTFPVLSALEPTTVVVIAFVIEGSANNFISAITDDNGNTYARFGSRSVDTGCPSSTEVWWTFVLQSAGSVMIQANAASNVDLWLLQIRGPSTSPYVSQQFTNTAVASTMPHAGTTMPPIPGGVIEVIGSCGTVTGVPGGSVFTPLSTTNGADTAYAFTTTGDLVSADFTTTNATWTSNMIVLH